VKVNATEPGALERLKAQVGIGSKLAVCHTAKIGSYIIEGHVPATDIKRLVAARRSASPFPACLWARPEWSKARNLSRTTFCYSTRIARPRSSRATETFRVECRTLSRSLVLATQEDFRDVLTLKSELLRRGQRSSREYPLWVISRRSSADLGCLLYPTKRTCSASELMSAKCH
jgi:hypothetical protein